MCEWLYENGADSTTNLPEKHGITPLISAAYHGHESVCRWLCSHGASSDIGRCNSWGHTPLWCAVQEGHLGVVRFLVAEGAASEMSALNEFGATLFFSACESGRLSVARWLVDSCGRSCDVKTRTLAGYSPMYAACYGGHLEVARWLFDHGAAADVRAVDADGNIPLIGACSNGRLDVAKWLLLRGGASVSNDESLDSEGAKGGAGLPDRHVNPTILEDLAVVGMQRSLLSFCRSEIAAHNHFMSNVLLPASILGPMHGTTINPPCVKPGVMLADPEIVCPLIRLGGHTCTILPLVREFLGFAIGRELRNLREAERALTSIIGPSAVSVGCHYGGIVKASACCVHGDDDDDDGDDDDDDDTWWHDESPLA